MMFGVSGLGFRVLRSWFGVFEVRVFEVRGCGYGIRGCGVSTFGVRVSGFSRFVVSGVGVSTVRIPTLIGEC